MTAALSLMSMLSQPVTAEQHQEDASGALDISSLTSLDQSAGQSQDALKGLFSQLLMVSEERLVPKSVQAKAMPVAKLSGSAPEVPAAEVTVILDEAGNDAPLPQHDPAAVQPVPDAQADAVELREISVPLVDTSSVAAPVVVDPGNPLSKDIAELARDFAVAMPPKAMGRPAMRGNPLFSYQASQSAPVAESNDNGDPLRVSALFEIQGASALPDVSEVDAPEAPKDNLTQDAPGDGALETAIVIPLQAPQSARTPPPSQKLDAGVAPAGKKTAPDPLAPVKQAEIAALPQPAKDAAGTDPMPVLDPGEAGGALAPVGDVRGKAEVAGSAESLKIADLPVISDVQHPLPRTERPSENHGMVKLAWAQAQTPVHEQIHVHIKQALQDGSDQITIKLTPPELGHLEIKMEMNREGQAQLLITVDNKDTLDLLQKDTKGLERALQEAGLKADSGGMEFNLKQGKDQSDQRDPAERLSEYEKGPQEADDAPSRRETVTPQYLEGEYRLVATEGLDIHV